MASFLIRVELHDAPPGIYKALHQQMENDKFLREIRGDSGKLYHLPEAEYFIEGDYRSCKEVRDKAVASVGRVWQYRFGVIVAGPTDMSWLGLNPV